MNTFNFWLDKLCGVNNWRAYCINLDIAAERKDTFSTWCKKVGLTCEFWKATDKNALVEEDYKICDVIVNEKFKSPGATACRLSHQRLMQYLLDTYPDVQYFFIFEDDAGFIGDKTQQLFRFMNDLCLVDVNWDSILFGYHITGHKKIIRLSETINNVLSSHLAHATIYKRSSIEAILFLSRQPETFKYPIDWITDIMRSVKSVTLGPTQSIIDQVDEFSFINFNTNNVIEVEDLMRCCVQYPTNIKGRLELNLNVKTLKGDTIFLPHNTIKTFLQNSRHLIHPVVVIAYDENVTIPNEILDMIDKDNKILAFYVNSPSRTSRKIINLDIKANTDITYWKKQFDSHK